MFGRLKFPFQRQLSLFKSNRYGNILILKGKTYDFICDIQGSNNYVEINENSRIDKLRITIQGNNHKLIIHKNVIIKKGIIKFEDSGNTIVIGAKTSFEDVEIGITEDGHSITIGEDCMLSHDIDIRNGDSHSIIDTVGNKRINHAKSISISDHVWIAADVKILKGVTIGANSIIGIGSIVTNDIPSNSLALGVPARTIRNNITWNRKRIA